MTAHRAAWVCHWQSTGPAKSYSVDVGVQQGILCRSTELSTLFCGKTTVLRQSRGKVGSDKSQILVSHYVMFIKYFANGRMVGRHPLLCLFSQIAKMRVANLKLSKLCFPLDTASELPLSCWALL